MTRLLVEHNKDKSDEQRMSRAQACQLFCRVRLARNFDELSSRRLCVLARLISVSVLSAFDESFPSLLLTITLICCEYAVYTRMIEQPISGISAEGQSGGNIFYTGFVEELVQMLHVRCL